LAMPAVSGTLEDLIRSGALPSVPKKPSSVFKIDHVKQKGRVTLVLFSDRELALALRFIRTMMLV
jgi:hypothetical protein